MAKEQFEEAKGRYESMSTQLMSKVEVLYELKIKNLKEQIVASKKAVEKYLNDGMRIFEVSDSSN